MWMFRSYAAPLCITGTLLNKVCYVLLILDSRAVQGRSSRAAVQLVFLSYQAENAFAPTKWQSQVKALDCSPRRLSPETLALEKRVDLLLIFLCANGRCCSCSRTQTWRRRGKPSWRRLGAKRRSSNRRSRRAWTNRSKGNRGRNCWRENGQKGWLRIQPELSDHYLITLYIPNWFSSHKINLKSTVFYSVEQRTTMLWWNFTAKKSECQTDLHHTEISTFIYLCPSIVENQGLMQTLL